MAAGGGVAYKDGFVTNALRELSVALCKGNGVLLRRSLGAVARATGRAFREGLAFPSAEVA